MLSIGFPNAPAPPVTGGANGRKTEIMDALLVDDSSTVLMRFQLLLERQHGVNVAAFTHPGAALLRAQMQAFDLVLVDQHMPGMDGTEFIRRLCEIPHYAQVPVVMITSDTSERVKLAALEAGATDFLDKQTDGTEFHVRLRNQIRLAAAMRRLDDQAAELTGKVRTAECHVHEREEEIIFRLALAVEYRDNDTGYHTWRVARYSQIMAQALGLDTDLCHRIYLASPLHDVGKVAIPDDVLLKKERLTAEEMATVRTHAAIGERILGESPSRLIRLAAEIAGGHHERWDGTGYPRGIAGLAIPLAARIVAVADVFDALTTVRPYKDAMPPEEALRLIEDEAGQHFDPACVAAFVSRWDEILDICATSARSQGFRGEPRPRDRDMPQAVAAQ